MAKAIAPDDPAWNEKNPRWATVSALVGKHLHEDATVAFAGESAIAQSWEHAIGLSLSNNDIDTLLAFFRSDLGRRYLELQNAIDDLVIEERFRVATNGVGTASAAAAASRRRVLDLWMSVIMIRGTMAPHASATIVAMIYTSSRVRPRIGTAFPAIFRRPRRIRNIRKIRGRERGARHRKTHAQ